MNVLTSGVRVRRRRSWYRRRLRIRRALITATMLALIAAACWQSAARLLSLPTLHVSSVLPDSFWTRGNIHKNLFLLPHVRVTAVTSDQATYPYSVIPGGIRSAADLRERAARDYVVRRHFNGFDYSRARLIRAGESREVFLSYRVRDRVYWTRKKVRLLAAELLLTDGKITARTRCGNQISETPKSEVSDQEPEREVLDQPVEEIAAIGPSLPFRFLSVRPNLPGADAIPPSPPELFAGGFMFPYVDPGTPLPHHNCKAEDGKDKKKCRPHPKPPKTPEPATLILISLGLVAIAWRYRRTAQPTMPAGL